jgi:hypothetical protein
MNLVNVDTTDCWLLHSLCALLRHNLFHNNHRRQRLDQLHRLQAHRNHSPDQPHDVLFVVVTVRSLVMPLRLL